MQRKRKIKFVYIYLVLLLMLVVGVFVYSFSTREAEPYDEVRNINNGASLNVQGGEAIDYSEGEEHSEPSLGYIFFSMNESDIFAGSLILVNHEHPFEFPVDDGLASLLTESTGTYGVLGANHYLYHAIIPTLDAMMAAYTEETSDETVVIISAFRGLEAQQAVLTARINLLGREEALRWVAEPGHSEHHTGLAIDLGIYVGYQRNFTGTGVSAWFSENAHRFGFILRYPQNSFDTTRVAYEPWHFRYIGKPHSFIVFQNELLLEDYIDYIRGYSFYSPLTFELAGAIYEIFFTDELDIRIPSGVSHEISGNNIDGFIVTLRRTAGN
ncbi:MAG: M15 family metallopeptidase [Oscillospiraceae bacterium]|nr:M15 family metallopeptidase [Oscillospiraceae bacterium]